MKKRTTLLHLFIAILLSFSILSGCLSTGSNGNEQETLTILVEDEDYARSRFIQYYETTHPEVLIEVVTLEDYEVGLKGFVTGDEQYGKYKQILTDKKSPDVLLIFDERMILKLIKDGLLQSLDSRIEEKSFQIEGMVPTVYETLKEMGNGNVYVLSPSFSSSALVYNKSLFDEIGQSYPNDGMTWDEVFQLSRTLTYKKMVNRFMVLRSAHMLK